MKWIMPKGEAPKLFLGTRARLVFLKKEDERAVLDLMRRFSNATRFAYSPPKALHAPGSAEDLGRFPPGERLGRSLGCWSARGLFLSGDRGQGGPRGPGRPDEEAPLLNP